MKNNLVVHKPQLRLLQESLNRGDFEVVINEAENLLKFRQGFQSLEHLRNCTCAAW